MRSQNAEGKLTRNPKLGMLGWGLAGGFIMGTGMPGATLGTVGVALFFMGAVKTLVQGPPALALLFFLVSVLLIYAGYTRYSVAYDREVADLGENEDGHSG
jgi:membrane protein implicated in regulation of membrane protease activity